MQRKSRFFGGFRVECIAVALLSAFCLRGQTLQPGTLDPDSSTTIDKYSSFPELMRARRWAEIAERAKQLVETRQQDAQAYYWLGVAKLRLHEPVAAAQALRSAERFGMHTPVAAETLGLAYYDLNQFFLFKEQMSKASQLDAADSKPHFYLGLYELTIRSDASAALAEFNKAAALAPGDWRSVFQAGYCLEQLGKLPAARDRYAVAMDLVEKQEATAGWPFQGMARLLLDDDPQRALTLAQRAVALEPDESSNHLLLAKIYDRLSRPLEAVREAEIAAAQNPTDSTTLYTLYKVYRAAGDPRAAKELRLFEEVKAAYDPD